MKLIDTGGLEVQSAGRLEFGEIVVGVAGSVNDAPWNGSLIRLAGAGVTTPFNLTGMVRRSTISPTVTVLNGTEQSMTLKHADTGSAVGNRFALPMGMDIVVPDGGGVVFVYGDFSVAWKLVSAPSSELGSVPVGGIVAWHKSLSGVPALPQNFLECNGQYVDDGESPLYGQTLPDLNGSFSPHTRQFIRGNTASDGSPGGSVSKDVNVTGQLDAGAVSATFCGGGSGSIVAAPCSQTLAATGTIDDIQPPYMDMVYIMRIK